MRSSLTARQGVGCTRLVYGSWGKVENYESEESITTELSSEVQDRSLNANNVNSQKTLCPSFNSNDRN
jgi:hypothetical protein